MGDSGRGERERERESSHLYKRGRSASISTEISEPTRTHSNQQLEPTTRTNNRQKETERDRKLNLERWRFYSIPFLILTTLSSDTLLHLLLADQRGSSACQEAWRRGSSGQRSTCWKKRTGLS